MAGKLIPLTLSTLGAALAFAVPAGAQGSKIPECPASTTLCPAVGSPATEPRRGQGAWLRIQPTVNSDGTWRAGDRIMY